MNANDIIEEIQNHAGEWIEMCEDPAGFVVGILANKIVKLNSYIEYLEKRLENVITNH